MNVTTVEDVVEREVEEATKPLRAENDRLRGVLCEIANRAGNMSDPDAAEWMPGIYKLACEAIDEDPWRLLRAAGHTPETLTVSFQQQARTEK